MKQIALKTNKLTKKYNSFVALNNADITVYKGDIYGIIGRNGAGKTTLMKTITDITTATSGEYEVFSKSGSAYKNEKNRVGCLIENPAFFENMTAYQNLKYYCIQKGITNYKRIDEVLETVNLTEAKDKKFKKFSLGMKQRLGIALAILDNPDLVVLDEPINGLDPIGISELRNTFHKLNEERGLTIMISSHILSELYAVANRFVFIEKGEVIKEMTKEELDNECAKCIVIKTNDAKKLVAVLENIKTTDFKVIGDDEVRIYSREYEVSELVKILVQKDVVVNGIYESGINLEDYFKQLINEN